MNLTALFNNNVFLTGVASGIVASAVFWILTKLLRLSIEFFQNQDVLNVWINSKIRYVYKNQEQAMTDILRIAGESDKIYVFAGFASTWTATKSDLRPLLSQKRPIQMKFLIFGRESKAAENRAKELVDAGFIEKSFTENYTSEIKTSIDVLKTYRHIDLALHDEPSRFRLYIFDNVMYVGFKLKEKHASKLQIFKIKKGSKLYDAFSQYFDDIWAKYPKEPHEEAITEKD